MTFDRSQPDQGVGLLPSATLVLWLACVAVGLVGIYWPPVLVHAMVPTEPAPVRMISVQNADNIRPPPAAQPIVQPMQDSVPPAEAAPPPPNLASLPPAPPMLAVAATRTPQMAFAEPVKARPTKATPLVEPVVQHLTYGQAEGAQPAPDYPIEAAMASQQGTVKVRFDVGEEGQILDAQAVLPCRWPLLNDAAVRAIRETWQFPPGPKRVYDVSIVFQLTQ
jgi:TonB family protein